MYKPSIRHFMYQSYFAKHIPSVKKNRILNCFLLTTDDTITKIIIIKKKN